MNKVKIKFKKLSDNATIPQYAKKGDAGLDLYATSFRRYEPMNGLPLYDEYGTDLAVEIPEGYVGLIFPRSSISKTGHQLKNSVGVVDSGYRGEIKFRFTSANNAPYKVGDKIGQMIVMPYPQVEVVETKELSDSERGQGGFGSTGS